MARPREFDPDQALDQAMDVFWQRGYRDTSLQDLLGAMGISKSSFYDNFGSKRECYLRSLERFGSMELPIDQLEAPGAGLDEVGSFLDRVIDGMTDTAGDGRGCMLMRGALELASGDAQVAGQVRSGFGRIEHGFRAALERAREQGRIAADVDLDGLSRLLLIVFYGVQVVSKADPDPDRLRAARSMLLRSLG